MISNAASSMGGAAVTGVFAVLAVYLQSRKTRRLNSNEHNLGQQAREADRDTLLGAINVVGENVNGVRADLSAHINDKSLHGPQVAIFNSPGPDAVVLPELQPVSPQG